MSVEEELYKSGYYDLPSMGGQGNILENEYTTQALADTNTDEKRRKLQEAAELKRDRLKVHANEADQNDSLGKGYTLRDDKILSNKNKIYNDLTD